MSAAATAAGYLYASGRLRGRGSKEEHKDAPKDAQEGHERKPMRVAALPDAEQAAQGVRPKRTPTVQYRTRRWRPDAA
jgi:hypothetical protein